MFEHNPNLKIPYKNELIRLLMISAGVFLFILFFQPFSLDKLDFNDRLLYVTGFGAITFFLGVFVLVIIPITIPKWFKTNEWESEPTIVLSTILLVLTATAYIFYIHFVGGSQLTLYALFKVFLVCLLPIIILIILYKNKSLERVIEILLEQNRKYHFQIKELSKLDEEITILSENKADKLKIKHKNILLIKSADNYIKIFYLRKEKIEKQLIRNTLKNIEEQLSNKLNFVRCHRTSIVNIIFIDKIIKSYSGNNLKISHLKDEIPVSRQYLTQIKGALTTTE